MYIKFLKTYIPFLTMNLSLVCVDLECIGLSTCVHRKLLARKCHLIHVIDSMCSGPKNYT
jgi:hypothetical protein